MPQITFYPIGNADTTLIELVDGRLILKDFCHTEVDDNRPSLRDEISDRLSELDRDMIDIVAFSHADSDHVSGADEFFYFDHAKKYQDDDRIKIGELHLPATFLTETGLKGAARIISAEAKHRLEEGERVKIYSSPEQLGDKYDPDNALYQHAGSCLEGITKDNGGAEIFVHSPLTYIVEEDGSERNGNSIVWHITFFEGDSPCRLILGADAIQETLVEIVKRTVANDNEDRLTYDLFRIPHHCSYLSLSAEKGTDETIPRDEIKDLYQMGNSNAILISSSNPIPSNADDAQPPHRQAAAFYKRIAREKGDESNFLVTMDWPPGGDAPSPIVVNIDKNCMTVQKDIAKHGGVAFVTERQSGRMGKQWK